MANADIPYGFQPSPLVRVRRYKTDASNTTAIAPGDIVMMEADGNIAAATAGSANAFGASVDYIAATTAGDVCVADHPDQEYEAQDDGAGGTPAQTYLFLNADHVPTSPHATLKRSRQEIDLSDATTVAAGFRLLQFIDNPEDTVTDFARWRVRLNENKIAGAASATGI